MKKQPQNPEDEFPMRLNRAVAFYGLATRREADVLIKAGRVFVSGRPGVLGERVTQDDRIEVRSDESEPEKELVYMAYYKPRGIITHSPQRREKAIADIAPLPNLFPVGRLDKESEGLIILTNDGRITDRLLNPVFAHEKEYAVRVREPVPPGAERFLAQGVVDGEETLWAKKVARRGPRELTIVLTQGKKHQIRRMLAALHLTVERLVRTRIGRVTLGALAPGTGRKLSGPARVRFLADLGLR